MKFNERLLKRTPYQMNQQGQLELKISQTGATTDSSQYKTWRKLARAWHQKLVAGDDEGLD